MAVTFSLKIMVPQRYHHNKIEFSKVGLKEWVSAFSLWSSPLKIYGVPNVTIFTSLISLLGDEFPYQQAYKWYRNSIRQYIHTSWDTIRKQCIQTLGKSINFWKHEIAVRQIERSKIDSLSRYFKNILHSFGILITKLFICYICYMLQ